MTVQSFEGVSDNKAAILKELLQGVSHIKHATIRIQGDKVIYFDPIEIKGQPKDADIIFISHSHGDHFSMKDIKKLAKDSTVLIMTGDMVETAVKGGFTNIVTVAPDKNYEIDGVKFSTVPAYNINKSFHKKESGWVGFIVEMNNTRYYVAGDTDIIPEMKNIKANVVFLPVGGTYTMTWDEAVRAAAVIKPTIAVPIHFGEIVGSREDAKAFVENLDESIIGICLQQ